MKKTTKFSTLLFLCVSASIMNAQDKQNTSSYIRPSLSPIEVTYGKGSLIKPNEIKFSGAVDITKLKNQSLEIGAVSTGTNNQFDTSGVSTFDKKVMASTFNFALDLIETNLYPKGGDKMDFFKKGIATYDLNYKLRNILIDYLKETPTKPILKDQRILIE